MQQQQHATTTTYESMQPQHATARGNIMQQRQQQPHARITRNNYRPTLRPRHTHTHTRCEDCGAMLPATARLSRAFLAPGSPGKTLAALPGRRKRGPYARRQPVALTTPRCARRTATGTARRRADCIAPLAARGKLHARLSQRFARSTSRPLAAAPARHQVARCHTASASRAGARPLARPAPRKNAHGEGPFSVPFFGPLSICFLLARGQNRVRLADLNWGRKTDPLNEKNRPTAHPPATPDTPLPRGASARISATVTTPHTAE